ncbi:MAG: hypothetical protein FWD18_11275 [Micrococcales bacterium]|nr:hypothetical protein [Micrococcales bacterium]
MLDEFGKALAQAPGMVVDAAGSVVSGAADAVGTAVDGLGRGVSSIVPLPGKAKGSDTVAVAAVGDATTPSGIGSAGSALAKVAVDIIAAKTAINRIREILERVPRSEHMGRWEGETYCAVSTSVEREIADFANELEFRVREVEALLVGYGDVLLAAADDLEGVNREFADDLRLILADLRDRSGEGDA